MSSHPKVVRSVVQALGHVGLASAVGLIGLPLVFGSPPEVGSLRAWLWLVLAAAIGVWLLVPAPMLIDALARLLARLPSQARHARPRGTPGGEAASLLMAAAYIVLLQAVARPAVVHVFGPAAEPFVVEAVLGATALVLLLAVLGWLHQAARPLVEGLARASLDVVLATSGSEHARRAEAPTQPVRVSLDVRTLAEPTRSSIQAQAQATPATQVTPAAQTQTQATQAAPTQTVGSRRPGRHGGLIP